MACNIISDRNLAEYLGLTASNSLVGLAAIYAQRACEAYVGFPLTATTTTEYYPTFDHFEADQFVDYEQTATLQRTERLRLKRRPLKLTGLQVWEDVGGYMGQKAGSFAASTELTLGTDFVVDLDTAGGSMSGHLLRMSGSWPTTVGSVKVTYKAGFNSTELNGAMDGGVDDYYNAQDVQQAVLMAALKNYNELKQQQPGMLSGVGGPLSYEKIEGYEYAVDKSISASFGGMLMTLPPMSKKLLSRYVNYGARLIA